MRISNSSQGLSNKNEILRCLDAEPRQLLAPNRCMTLTFDLSVTSTHHAQLLPNRTKEG